MTQHDDSVGLSDEKREPSRDFYGTFWAKNKDRLLEFDDMEFHATEKQVKKVEARRESALLEKCAEKKKAADAWE